MRATTALPLGTFRTAPTGQHHPEEADTILTAARGSLEHPGSGRHTTLRPGAARLLDVHAFTLDAPGLVLSAPRPDDIDTVTAICQDAAIARWTTIPSPYMRQDAENFCLLQVPNGWSSGAMLTWAVRADPEGEPIAMVSLTDRAAGSWEVGFWTAPHARGQGVMGRAVRAVIEKAFAPDGPIGAQRLEWRCEFDGELPNWASWRVAWRAGFHKQARLRSATTHAGIRRDMWLADLLVGDALEPAAPWDGPLDPPEHSAFGTPVTPSDAHSIREGDQPEGLVRRFHRIYGLPIVQDAPSLDRAHLHLRMKLVAEEFGELVGAVYGRSARRLIDEAAQAARAADDSNRDLVATADALADLVYVIYGMALETGIDLPAVLAEVQRSNMSKLGADGLPIHREDGKVLKGPDYRPPDIAAVLSRSALPGPGTTVRPQA